MGIFTVTVDHYTDLQFGSLFVISSDSVVQPMVFVKGCLYNVSTLKLIERSNNCTSVGTKMFSCAYDYMDIVAQCIKLRELHGCFNALTVRSFV